MPTGRDGRLMRWRRQRGLVYVGVYVVSPEDAAAMDAAVNDEYVSRHSIRIVHARHFGKRTDAVYVFVRGPQEGILRADALFLEFAERADDGDVLWARLEAEDEAAAESLGRVFRDDEEAG